jgi:uncharacterized protein (TIGR02186 family)
MVRLVLMLLVLLTSPARAEDLVLGLSQNRIAITANFDGSEILVFGAVRRDAPAPEGELGVIVTITGPSEPVTVWRKARRFGIWINAERADVDLAPTFYAVATNAPWGQIISDTEDLRHRVSIDRAIRSIGNLVQDSPNFTAALIRLREASDLYQNAVSTVELAEDTLFSVAVALPANLTEGTYITRVLLTRNRQVIADQRTAIDVQKVGLERFLYRLAHDQPLVYGLLSILIAVAAGWGASAAFRWLRG